MSIEGVFAWQFPNPDREKAWRHYSFNKDRWWGDFALDLPEQMDTFSQNPWAIGPFAKYPNNPVFAPEPGAWDCGRYDGGVHNGSIVRHNDLFYYVYRGERPIDISQDTTVDYICDIGVAISRDGVVFDRRRDCSPFFRTGKDRQYSYEDVNIVRHEGVYYLFCNQWLWERMDDTSQNGTYLATSTDLLHWEKHGIVFPEAKRIHRNGVVIQSPTNDAVRIDGQFVMYINDGIIARSPDLIHWESFDIPAENRWPGGEGCFALAEHNPQRPDDILLFTGGNHTGHFYAVGEVLLSKQDITKPKAWLPRSPLFAEAIYQYENGFDVNDSNAALSSFADCIFFNGLTLHDGKYWVYYGGSEYYTCLATADAI